MDESKALELVKYIVDKIKKQKAVIDNIEMLPDISPTKWIELSNGNIGQRFDCEQKINITITIKDNDPIIKEFETTRIR